MFDWCRLWHDMPNDPKWRVAANKTGVPLSQVIAAAVVWLSDASANTDNRGAIKISVEEVAAVIDTNPENVQKIYDCLQGAVLDGDRFKSWGRRQPQREDSSTERVRKYRQKNQGNNRANGVDITQCNADVTQCNADVTQRNAPDTDTDTDTELKDNTTVSTSRSRQANRDLIAQKLDKILEYYPKLSGNNPKSKAIRALNARLKEGCNYDEIIRGVQRYAEFIETEGNSGTKFVMQTATFLGPDKNYLNDWRPSPQKKPSWHEQRSKINRALTPTLYENSPFDNCITPTTLCIGVDHE